MFIKYKNTGMNDGGYPYRGHYLNKIKISCNKIDL